MSDVVDCIFSVTFMNRHINLPPSRGAVHHKNNYLWVLGHGTFLDVVANPNSLLRVTKMHTRIFILAHTHNPTHKGDFNNLEAVGPTVTANETP